MIKSLQRLGELCRAWGGELRVLRTIDEFNAYFPEVGVPEVGVCESSASHRSLAPFADWHGVDWSQKHVVTVRGEARVNGVIHEMGHVFASKYPPDNDIDASEFDFFGWEVAVARMVGSFRTWSADNDAYQVTNDNLSWGQCGGQERRRIIAERTARARDLGMLDTFMRPVSIR